MIYVECALYVNVMTFNQTSYKHMVEILHMSEQ